MKTSSRKVTCTGTSLAALKVICQQLQVRYSINRRQTPQDQRNVVIQALKDAGIDVRGC